MRAAVVVLLAALAGLVGLPFVAATAEAHYPTITYAKKRIYDTNVNGLCGKGTTYFCVKSHIVSQYLYASADGHWRVFKVQYAEGRLFDPWGARHCVVNRVSVSGNGVVGTPTRASYCYK